MKLLFMLYTVPHALVGGSGCISMVILVWTILTNLTIKMLLVAFKDNLPKLIMDTFATLQSHSREEIKSHSLRNQESSLACSKEQIRWKLNISSWHVVIVRTAL